MMKIKVIINHLKTVLKHKYWVMIYCFKCGLIWRGIKHDLSKFSFVEFNESIKYYTGTKSPIDVCKQINGVSYAWQHHRGRNDHHYEYWIDNLDNGGVPVKMPYKCAVEMICDMTAASRVYSGENFEYKGLLRWYINKITNLKAKIHPHTKLFCFYVIDEMVRLETMNNSKIESVLDKKHLKELYNKADMRGKMDIKGMEEELEDLIDLANNYI